ncbi:MAG: hypothetical protein ONB46_01055 [candidate division KSB1 bacterium]|nr:hypothetical protein [candidate division KSB1 bacterium]MDZ7364570.1 hypothetical protein [candidate division KSB1 bacterium]MDZ7402682.1 hypothetical protein [candidate division KSB1 bacterium]
MAKPTTVVLNKWLGPEAIAYFKEKDIRELIKLHMNASQTEIEKVEGQGALNFLSGKKWIVLVDADDSPRLVVDSDEFIREALFEFNRFNPYRHCHRPLIARSGRTTIGDIISLLQVKPSHSRDDVVDHDVILLWGEDKRVITGADVLGRLLRGIVRNPATGDL